MAIVVSVFSHLKREVLLTALRFFDCHEELERSQRAIALIAKMNNFANPPDLTDDGDTATLVWGAVVLKARRENEKRKYQISRVHTKLLYTGRAPSDDQSKDIASKIEVMLFKLSKHDS
jgi:hypothetical protein